MQPKSIQKDTSSGLTLVVLPLLPACPCLDPFAGESTTIAPGTPSLLTGSILCYPCFCSDTAPNSNPCHPFSSPAPPLVELRSCDTVLSSRELTNLSRVFSFYIGGQYLPPWSLRLHISGKFSQSQIGDQHRSHIYTKIIHLFYPIHNLLSTQVDYKLLLIIYLLFLHMNPVLCFLSPI